MRHSLLAVVIFCLCSLSTAQEAAAPAAPIPTPAELDQAIEDFARQIPAGITADRYAAIAVAMPQDAAEYEALNKHALLVVAALSKDASELPLKRVYVEQTTRTLQATLIMFIPSEMPADSAAAKLMGSHRVTAYYLIPTSAWLEPGTLLVDFGAHRQEFILGKFPQPLTEEFILGDPEPDPMPGRMIGSEALRAILDRNQFPLKASREWDFHNITCDASSRPNQPPVCGQERTPQIRIRVKPEIAEGMLARKVAADYPEAARNAGMQGEVVLSLAIGKDGVPHDVYVVRGSPLLAEAAVEAVQQWRYRPYRLHGRPTEVWTRVTVTFRLP